MRKLLGDFYFGADAGLTVPVESYQIPLPQQRSDPGMRAWPVWYPTESVGEFVSYNHESQRRRKERNKKKCTVKTLSRVLPYLNYDIQSCQVAVLLGSDNPEDEEEGEKKEKRKRHAKQSQ